MKNVLIIHTDQQRYDSLGCTGNPHAMTPNIDRLAAEGILFTRHIAANSVCMPSRATLMTGRYPVGHGVWDNGVALNRREYMEFSRVRDGEGIVIEPVTIADVFAQHGYRTACFGKMHLTPFFSPPSYGYPESQLHWQRDPESLRDWHGPYYGFEHVDLAFTHGQLSQGHYRLWLRENHPEVYRAATESEHPEVIPGLKDLYPADVPLELHPTMWLAERFESYLEDAAGNAPFMAFIGFPDPHHPWAPTREALEIFKDSDVLPPADPEGAGLRGYVFGGTGSRIGGWTDEQKRIVRRYTLAQVYQIDLAVGRIRDALQRRGLWGQTLVVFTSDHGDFLGDHGFLRKGVCAAHSLLRLPFVLRVPWAEGLPARMDATMSNCDVLATALAQVGLPGPEHAQGRDIFEAMHSGARHRAYADCGRGTPDTNNYTVYDDRYRYTIYPQRGREELFDHEADPGESRNLAGEPAHAGRCRAMLDQVKDHLLRHRTPIVGRVGPW